MPKFRETPVTFTVQEAGEIRDAMGKSLIRVICPRCGNVLRISDPMAREGSMGESFEVRCDPCHRVAIITEVPGTRRPESDE